jgi:hypothetical protein
LQPISTRFMLRFLVFDRATADVLVERAVPIPSEQAEPWLGEQDREMAGRKERRPRRP